MVKILVCDTSTETKEDYDLKNILTNTGFYNVEVINTKKWDEADRIIKTNGKFNLMILSYNLMENDSHEMIEFMKKHRDISSILLDYQANRGISKYVICNFSSKRVYKNEAINSLGGVIKSVIDKK